MRPSELTAYVVREELEHLINNYPERTGTIQVEDDDPTYVYYTDEDGFPISMGGLDYDDFEELDPINLKTPVCIVGMWVENFHPEFKEDEMIRGVIVRNSTMRYSETPFAPEVHELLKRAQEQQDSNNSPWGTINLDIVDAR